MAVDGSNKPFGSSYDGGSKADLKKNTSLGGVWSILGTIGRKEPGKRR